MHPLTREIRKYLKDHANPERAKGAQQFFKEGFKTYGANKPALEKFVRQSVRKCYHPLALSERMIIAEELLANGMYEEAQAAYTLLERYGKEFDHKTLMTFSRWIDSYVENWGVSDSFCIRIVYHVFINHPELVGELTKWANSKNRWKRRAACATLSKLSREGEFLDEVLAMAERLLGDDDELVQKGIGWMLKEVSRTRSDEVLGFIEKYHTKMPRIVMRCAIERMDKKTRQEILNKY